MNTARENGNAECNLWIGYQFEYGKYLSVKVPGGKWYHQLDKLDECFGEESFKNYLDMGFSRPRFISTNPLYLYRSGLSEFQLKFYHKMDVERISNRQKEIYKESGMRKRTCITRAMMIPIFMLYQENTDIRSPEYVNY